LATFTGQLISATYDAIIKTIDNDAIGGTAKQLTDGLGNVTPLYVSTTQIGIGITPTEALHVSGNIKASSSVIATTFSGDLNGTINTATTGVTQTAGDNTTKIATTAFVQESHAGKPTGSGTGGKIALWSGSGTSTVLTDSSITEESTQYLLTKDIKIFDTIPVITLQDSDSSGSASSGDITWIDNAASQRAIISLSNSILGITSKHGGINFGTNSTPAVSIDSSQNTEFFGSISSTSTITATSYIQSDSNLLVKGDLKFRNNADTSWNGGQIGSDANDSLRFAVKTAASSNVEALTLDANLKANFTGSIAIGGNATTIASFVTESDTIASNDNDTTLPTSAAVKDYVDTQVGANNELSEVLANGNITDGTDIVVSTGDQILLPDGSSTSPAITFSGDTNTGMYRTGSDVLNLGVGGSDAISMFPTAVYIKPAGSTELTISGSGSTFAGDVDVNGTLKLDTNGILQFGANTATPSMGVAIHRSAADTLNFVTASTNRLTIDSDGDATFAGNVDVTGNIIARANASYYATRNYLGETWELASDTADGVTFKITGGAANTTGNYFRFQTQSGGATAATALTINKDLSSTFAGSITGLTSSFVSTVAGTTVVSAEGAYTNSGSVKLFEAKRNGGAVKSDWDYHDSSPIRMSIGTSTSHSFAIKTADTPRLTIDSLGKVIINDNAIGDKLLLAGDDAGTARGLVFNCSTTTNQGDTWDIDAQSSTGIIKFSTGSTEKMRLDSSGTLSIGPDALDIQLKAASNNSGKNLIYLRGNATGDKAEISLNHFGYANMFIGMGTTANTVMSLTATSGGTDGIIIDSDGNVGINRSSPNGLLHQQSEAGSNSEYYIQTGDTTTNSTIYFGDSDASVQGGIDYDHNDDSMSFKVNNSPRMVIDSSGQLNLTSGTYHKLIATFPSTYKTNLQIGQQLNISNDAISDTVTFAHSGTEASSDFIFTIAGNEKLKIQGNGTTKITTDGTEQLILHRSDSSIFENNTIGTIKVSADDPTANVVGAQIQFTGGGTWSSNNYPTNIIFSNDNAGTLTPRLTIDSSGNLGVGNPNPTYQLDILGAGANDGVIHIKNTTSTHYPRLAIQSDVKGYHIGVGGSGAAAGYKNDLYFYDNNQAEVRMRIDTLGQVGIGAPDLPTDVYTASGGGYAVLGMGQSSFLTAYKADDSIELCQNTYLNTSGVNRGIIASVAAARLTLVDGSFVFTTLTTGADKSQNATNVMRITSGGQIEFAATYNNTTASAANMHISSAGGQIFRSTSSLKYKTDVRDYDKGLNEVMQLQPKYYKGKDDGDTQFAGLIAEDVNDLGLSEFVQYAEDGTPDALAYTHMVALLVKSIQELKAEIDDLKNKCNCK